MGSVAEAELLSQLSAILMPDTEIRESFRSFPAPMGIIWSLTCQLVGF